MEALASTPCSILITANTRPLSMYIFFISIFILIQIYLIFKRETGIKSVASHDDQEGDFSSPHKNQIKTCSKLGILQINAAKSGHKDPSCHLTRNIMVKIRFSNYSSKFIIIRQ